MRTILFRGKRVDNGEWVYGVPIKDKDTNGFFESAHIDGDTVILMLVLNDNFRYDDYIVLPETVGQYTGLRDKNGARIFEGDVVIVNGNLADESDYRKRDLAKIFFEYGMFTHGWVEPYLNDNHHIVVGNIHDNPELLGGD